MERKGKCNNVGVCTLAGKVQVITDDDAEFKCTECGEELEEVKDEQVIVEPPKNKKWIFILLAIILLAAIGFGIYLLLGGSKEPVIQGGGESQDTTIVATGDTVVTPTITYIEEMQIDGGNFTMKSGDTKQLTATIAPEKHDESLAWSSDKEDVATVDPSGLVTAKKAGTATILLTADKSAKQAQVTVKVIPVDNTDDSSRQNLGWGIYEGPANGFGGTITVTSTHTIDLKKASGETVIVNRGDKIVGVKMDNGRLRQGEIHFADGTRKYLSGL